MRKDKRTRFTEVAGGRTNRVINDLRLLGNCSNRNNYEYSDEDIRKMFAAIEDELRSCKAKYLSKAAKKPVFKF